MCLLYILIVCNKFTNNSCWNSTHFVCIHVSIISKVLTQYLSPPDICCPCNVDSLNREFLLCGAFLYLGASLITPSLYRSLSHTVDGSHLNVFWTGVVFTTFVTSRLKILKLVLQGVKGAQEANFHNIHKFIWRDKVITEVALRLKITKYPLNYLTDIFRR